MIKNRITFSDFSRWRFDLDGALGSYLWDKSGQKLLDFTSGWNVTNLGWNNPEITEAVVKELERSSYVPGWSDDSAQIRLAQKLLDTLPQGLNTFARATGGTEAIEEALKTARAFTGRKKIVSFKDSYHGHSLGALALGYDPAGAIAKAVGPLPEGFIQLDFPAVLSESQDKDAVLTNFAGKLENSLLDADVAAVVTEAGIITGWGSTAIAPEGYLRLVRELTTKYGTLLILDEVGTGFSRLGRLWGMQLEEIIPDIVVFAKGMSNGVAPIGAMVTTEEIAGKSSLITNIYSTFGWLPVACAASLKTLEIHLREKIWGKAEADGEYLQQSLRTGLKDLVQHFDIRGKGLEIGLTLLYEKESTPSWADRIVKEAFANGLHLVGDHEKNIQLMPPLTITREELNHGLDILIETIKTDSHR